MKFNMTRTARRKGTEGRGEKAVAVWLMVVAGLVFAMIAVGGATRLTDSGLSITEWQPILGAVPPLSEEDWQTAFAKYKESSEYQKVNQGMNLDAFKVIYWWEWGHRFLGRIVGAAFALPLVFFWWTGVLRPGLLPRLLGILALGGLQGAVGWYMVMSGLADRVDVSPYRLALHLGIAFLILGALIWTVLDLLSSARVFGAGRHRKGWRSLLAGVLTAAVFLQVIAGAFVAGTRAGRVYNTWPLMNGEFFPEELGRLAPWYRNLFEDIALVQFNHRLIAYIVAVLAVANIWAALRIEGAHRLVTSAILVAAAIGLQITLGIWTLLAAVPLPLGLAHQAGAAVVFAFTVRHFHLANQASA